MVTIDQMQVVTEGLEHLAVWVERWAEIMTWPVNEVWMLLIVVNGTWALLAALLIVRGIWGFLRGLFSFLFAPRPSRWHCHECTMQQQEYNRELMRKIGAGFKKLWQWASQASSRLRRRQP